MTVLIGIGVGLVITRLGPGVVSDGVGDEQATASIASKMQVIVIAITDCFRPGVPELTDVLNVKLPQDAICEV